MVESAMKITYSFLFTENNASLNGRLLFLFIE